MLSNALSQPVSRLGAAEAAAGTVLTTGADPALAGAGAGAIGAYIGGPIADSFGYVFLFAIYGVLFLLSFLLNSPYGASEVFDHLPGSVQKQILDKKLDLWVIDAAKVAADVGMGSRINTIMQACFFAISKILPKDESIAAIKDSIK